MSSDLVPLTYDSSLEYFDYQDSSHNSVS